MNPDFLAKLLAALGSGPAHPPPPPSGPGPSAILAALGMTPAPQVPAGQPGRPSLASLLNKAPQMSPHALFSSPFADTLRAVAGTPSVMRTGDTGFSNAIGRYTGVPGADTLTLRDDALNRDAWAETPPGMDRSGVRVPEYILAHEMGHRYDNAHQFHTPVDSVRAANGAPTTGYAAQGRGEHTAEAFANAIDYLRTAASPQGRDVSIADYERSVPGTRAVATDLLTNSPIYQHHPLNLQRLMAAHPDATAVRKP